MISNTFNSVQPSGMGEKCGFVTLRTEFKFSFLSKRNVNTPKSDALVSINVRIC